MSDFNKDFQSFGKIYTDAYEVTKHDISDYCDPSYFAHYDLTNRTERYRYSRMLYADFGEYTRKVSSSSSDSKNLAFYKGKLRAYSEALNAFEEFDDFDHKSRYGVDWSKFRGF